MAVIPGPEGPAGRPSLFLSHRKLEDIPTRERPYPDIYQPLSNQCSSLHKVPGRQLTAGSLLSFLITIPAIL